MDAFIVDGAKQTLADIIISKKVSGKTCSVASWGFGVRHVERLINAFDQLLLVADASHSQLNKTAYRSVVKMSEKLDYFTFRPARTHVKLALIDDEIIIFTSANLSANRRLESYIIGHFCEINGIDEIKRMFDNPGAAYRKRWHAELTDIGIEQIDIDIGFMDMDFESFDL